MKNYLEIAEYFISSVPNAKREIIWVFYETHKNFDQKISQKKMYGYVYRNLMHQMDAKTKTEREFILFMFYVIANNSKLSKLVFKHAVSFHRISLKQIQLSLKIAVDSMRLALESATLDELIGTYQKSLFRCESDLKIEILANENKRSGFSILDCDICKQAIIHCKCEKFNTKGSPTNNT